MFAYELLVISYSIFEFKNHKSPFNEVVINWSLGSWVYIGVLGPIVFLLNFGSHPWISKHLLIGSLFFITWIIFYFYEKNSDEKNT